MGVFKTSKKRFVVHCHLGQTPWCKPFDHSEETIELIRQQVRNLHADAEELEPPTWRYNCMGFALAGAHGWFNFPEVILRDDFFNVSLNQAREGDVVKYEKNNGLAHVGIVTEVSNGQILRVRSKWGDWSELSHRPNDVPATFGEVTALVRRRPEAVPFAEFADVRETWEGTSSRELLEGNNEMSKQPRSEVVDRAINLISNPEIYLQVGLASTPEVARSIIETLPGVAELIETGPEAIPAILDVLEDAEQRNNQHLLGITLYIIQRIPTPETVRTLARGISERRFNGLNLFLAADALLVSADIPIVNEDRITVALREAENLK